MTSMATQHVSQICPAREPRSGIRSSWLRSVHYERLGGGALSGGSVGEALGQELANGPKGRGNLFIALDPAALAGEAAFIESASVFLDAIGLSSDDASQSRTSAAGKALA